MFRKWLKDQNNIARKTAGMEEKLAATKRKMEVALSILDRREMERRVEERRQVDIPVEFERRHGYHQKLA